MKPTKAQLPKDYQAHWRKMLDSDPIVIKAIEVVSSRRPVAYKLKDVTQTVESVALQGAYSEGFNAAVQLFQAIAFEAIETQESAYIATDVD